MTPPKKPEWMELADEDRGEPSPLASKPRIARTAILAIASLVLGVSGVIFALGNDESPASADEIVTTQNSQSAAPVAPAIESNNPTSSAKSSPTAPSIATPPAMRSGERDHEFRELHPDGDNQFGEREGHERGERDDEFEEH